MNINIHSKEAICRQYLLLNSNPYELVADYVSQDVTLRDVGHALAKALSVGAITQLLLSSTISIFFLMVTISSSICLVRLSISFSIELPADDLTLKNPRLFS